MTTGNTSADALLDITNLRYRWPGADRDTLFIERFTVAPGERVFLRGASGSGKSTLLNIVGGVLKARSGRVAVLGNDLSTMNGARRDRFRAEHIGFIFQQFNLLPYLNVIENVLLGCRFAPGRRARVGAAPNAEARRLLAELGLEREGVLDMPVGRLSVGQQQRVAVARALLGRPELVVADEPTSALDSDARDAFMSLLIDECRQAGSGLLFVSHDASLGARLDRVVELGEINRPQESAA